MTTDGRPVLLVGASGLAREVLPLLAEEGRPVLGVLDDRYADLPPVLPPPYDHVPVLGPVSSAPDHPDAALLLCVGPSPVRAALRDLLGPGAGFATVVDRSVRNPAACEIGVGSILMAHVAITADAVLGEHVVAMPGVTVTHDCVVGDVATLAAGVALGGGVVVGPGAYLGMNASVHPGVRVGAGATVGMGAVVLHDVPDGETWAGVPARRLVPRPAPVANPRRTTATQPFRTPQEAR
jgi:sugar O-acyltransferase (sialic acid O-acetyltransferase NeuD family)